MSDLIERLRNLNQHGFIKYDDLFIRREAADELERLQRENESLNLILEKMTHFILMRD